MAGKCKEMNKIKQALRLIVPITIGWCRVEELVHVRASDEGLLVCCDGRNHSVLEIAVGCPKANSKIKGKSPWRKNVSE